MSSPGKSEGMSDVGTSYKNTAGTEYSGFTNLPNLSPSNTAANNNTNSPSYPQNQTKQSMTSPSKGSTYTNTNTVGTSQKTSPSQVPTNSHMSPSTNNVGTSQKTSPSQVHTNSHMSPSKTGTSYMTSPGKTGTSYMPSTSKTGTSYPNTNVNNGTSTLGASPKQTQQSTGFKGSAVSQRTSQNSHTSSTGSYNAYTYSDVYTYTPKELFDEYKSDVQSSVSSLTHITYMSTEAEHTQLTYRPLFNISNLQHLHMRVVGVALKPQNKSDWKSYELLQKVTSGDAEIDEASFEKKPELQLRAIGHTSETLAKYNLLEIAKGEGSKQMRKALMSGNLYRLQLCVDRDLLFPLDPIPDEIIEMSTLKKAEANNNEGSKVGTTTAQTQKSSTTSTNMSVSPKTMGTKGKVVASQNISASIPIEMQTENGTVVGWSTVDVDLIIDVNETFYETDLSCADICTNTNVSSNSGTRNSYNSNTGVSNLTEMKSETQQSSATSQGGTIVNENKTYQQTNNSDMSHQTAASSPTNTLANTVLGNSNDQKTIQDYTSVNSQSRTSLSYGRTVAASSPPYTVRLAPNMLFENESKKKPYVAKFPIYPKDMKIPDIENKIQLQSLMDVQAIGRIFVRFFHVYPNMSLPKNSQSQGTGGMSVQALSVPVYTLSSYILSQSNPFTTKQITGEEAIDESGKATSTSGSWLGNLFKTSKTTTTKSNETGQSINSGNGRTGKIGTIKEGTCEDETIATQVKSAPVLKDDDAYSQWTFGTVHPLVQKNILTTPDMYAQSDIGTNSDTRRRTSKIGSLKKWYKGFQKSDKEL